MFSVKNKIIVVTGGDGLLGKQIIDKLREREAIAIAIDISFTNQGIYDYIVDITDENSVKKCVGNILKKYKKIDGWVNNAYPRTKDWSNRLEDVSVQSWRKNIDMHLNGYFICCQIILMQMKNQGFGSLINMSSIYGLVGPDFNVYNGTNMTMPAAYSAIKGGLNNLTRYLASYYGEFQVRVNTISPGGIFNNQEESFVNNYIEKVPMKRMGKPEDIVAAVFYLISDESNYITGQNLIIDGGWTAI